MESSHCSRRQGSVRHGAGRRVNRCYLLFFWMMLLGSLFASPLQAQTRQIRPDIAWSRGWNSTGSPGQCAFSPDGSLVAIAGGSNLKLITTVANYLVTTFPSRNSTITGVAFSPDGTTLVDVGSNGIELWSTQNPAPARILDTNSWAAVAFSPDGKSIATENNSDQGAKVVLWNVASGAQLLTFTNPYPNTFSGGSLAYTPDGTGLAIAGQPSTLCSTTNGSVLQTFAGTISRTVAVSPNGKFVGTVDSIPNSSNQIANVWSIGTGPHYTLNPSSILSGAQAFTPDSSELIVGGALGASGMVFSTSNGTELATLPDDYNMAGIGFTNGVIYTVDQYLLKEWNSTTFALITNEPEIQFGITAIAISPDGKTVATGGGSDYTIDLWNASDGTLLRTLDDGTGAITGVAFSADSQTLITSDSGQYIRVWKVSDGTLTRSFIATGAGSTLALSPDGVTIALGAGSNTIQLWNYISSKLVTTLTGHSAAVNSLAFSPDGKTLASGSSDDTIKLWNLVTGTLQKTLTGHTKAVNSVAFSPDGTQLLSGSSDTTAILWSVASGLQQASFPHSWPVYTVSFAPNGATFLTGTNSGSSTGANQIKVWNLSNKTLIQNYTQEMGNGITASTFSPNSQQFLYSRSDVAFALANVPTTSLLAFDFDGDGHNDLVLQNSQTGQIAVWNMNGTDVLGGSLLSTVPIAGWNVAGVGDFNRDGFPDLVLQNATSGQVVLWYMNNTTYLGGQATSFAPGSSYKVVAVGDFNGDGNPDLVFQDSVTNKIVIWYMNGPNVIGGVSVPYIPAANYHIVGTGDFNGDGQTDLLFQNSSTGQLVVWYMNGANYVGGAAITTIPGSGWVAKGVADYNNDGMPDIVFQNTTTNQAIIWYMNGLVFTGGSLTSYLPASNYRIAGPH